MNVLNRSVLAVLLPGFSHTIDLPQGAEAIISYGSKGEALLALPGKAPMSGKWHLLPDGYYVAWENGPSGDWQIRHEAGRLTYVDSTGKDAGTVTRIEPFGLAAAA